MAPKKIDLPPTLVEAVIECRGERGLARWGLEVLVTSAVADEIITTGHAAGLLGLSHREMLDFLSAKGIQVSAG